MFIDQATIHVKAGNGGDGAVSFHTAKYIPNGGPDGGDGGRGGDVIFVARSGQQTLQVFRYQKKFKAEHGQNGSGKKKTGRSGEHRVIDVPIGTLIRDAQDGKILADLTEEGQTYVVARGGKGGKGNIHFANSVRQAPRFARPGDPGEERKLVVELKLVADVGLIGFPNAGKSTLLSVISAAKPKIAPYPFTTLEPSLGVVTVDDFSFIAADIPGLVPGAHEGVGLGLSFLRHIERTRLFVHVLDASSETGRDPVSDYEQILEELRFYNSDLLERPQLIALNKIDQIVPERLEEIIHTLREKGLSVYPISAVRVEGVPELVQAIAARVRQLPPVLLHDSEKKEAVYRYAPEPLFSIERDKDVFRVTGSWIENLVRATQFDHYESLQYFQRLIRRKGVIEALEEAGIREGDRVVLYDYEFEYVP